MTPAIEHVARLLALFHDENDDPDRPVEVKGDLKHHVVTKRRWEDYEPTVRFVAQQLRAWETNQ